MGDLQNKNLRGLGIDPSDLDGLRLLANDKQNEIDQWEQENPNLHRAPVWTHDARHGRYGNAHSAGKQMSQGAASRLAREYRDLARDMVKYEWTGGFAGFGKKRKLGPDGQPIVHLRSHVQDKSGNIKQSFLDSAEWKKMLYIRSLGINPDVRYKNVGKFEGFLGGVLTGWIEGMIPFQQGENDLLTVTGGISPYGGAGSGIKKGLKGFKNPNLVDQESRPWTTIEIDQEGRPNPKFIKEVIPEEEPYLPDPSTKKGQWRLIKAGATWGIQEIMKDKGGGDDGGSTGGRPGDGGGRGGGGGGGRGGRASMDNRFNSYEEAENEMWLRNDMIQFEADEKAYQLAQLEEQKQWDREALSQEALDSAIDSLGSATMTAAYEGGAQGATGGLYSDAAVPFHSPGTKSANWGSKGWNSSVQNETGSNIVAQAATPTGTIKSSQKMGNCFGTSTVPSATKGSTPGGVMPCVEKSNPPVKPEIVSCSYPAQAEVEPTVMVCTRQGVPEPTTTSTTSPPTVACSPEGQPQTIGPCWSGPRPTTSSGPQPSGNTERAISCSRPAQADDGGESNSGAGEESGQNEWDRSMDYYDEHGSMDGYDGWDDDYDDVAEMDEEDYWNDMAEQDEMDGCY